MIPAFTHTVALPPNWLTTNKGLCSQLPHDSRNREALSLGRLTSGYSLASTCQASMTAFLEQTKDTLSTSGGTCFDELSVDVVVPFLKIREDCKKNVLERTELLKIPESLLLTPKSARSTLSEAYPAAKEELESFADEALLALGILYERSLGSTSAHSTLVSQLPGVDDIDCPSLWTEEQLNWLSGSPVWASVMRVRGGVTDEFERAQQVFGDVPWLGKQSADYVWACAIVDSRAVRASQAMPLVLAPLLHCIQVAWAWGDETEENASTIKANAEVSMSGVRMFFSRRNLIVSAMRKLQPGDEVKLSARGQDMDGITTNGQLLLERGRVVEETSAQGVEVGFELAALDKFRDDKLDILSSLSSDDNSPIADDSGAATFVLRAADKRGLWMPPSSMDAFLRLICLSGTDSFLLEPVFRADVWGFMQLPVSAENEQAICDLIIGACEDALDAYLFDGNKSKDVDKREQTVPERRKRLARIVVQGEKGVLNAAKAYYERVAQSLDVLEYYAERRLKQLDLLRPLDESEIIDSESGAQVGRAFDENYR